MKKIGFIGAGNMGSALAKAAVKSGARVYIYDKDIDKAERVALEVGAHYMTNLEIAESCDYVYLAVKPDIIPVAMKEIGEALDKNSKVTLVSMAAGVSIDKISPDKKYPIIRIMPNTPAAIGQGMILWCKNKAVTKEALNGFLKTMSHSGLLEEIEESKIDAASAISGCGPAFVYMFIDALADGGVEAGLTRKSAQRLAAQTILGAAKMTLDYGKHPAELKDAVCSPGGSTIAGVAALEKGAFRATCADAVRASYEKTKKLCK